MIDKQSPRVFLSHASEDKERFVLAFAEKLRANGIDVWLDKWAMLPGDSLVDKIFEEGLGEASAVIVVLSKVSVDKPWVREELNTGLIKRIEKGCKLIPVVIDDCIIPECIRSTVWEPIRNLNDYDASFNRIVGAIFGHREKPVIGDQPSYTKESIIKIPSLTKTDNLVLKMSCEDAVTHGNLCIEPENIFAGEVDEFVIPETELSDSLEVLERRGFIKLHRTTGVRLYSYLITSFGFDQYIQAYISEYSEIQQKVMRMIVLDEVTDNQKLAVKLEIPRLVIDHILDLLESHGLLKQGESSGCHSHLYNVSPEMRRMLEDY